MNYLNCNNEQLICLYLNYNILNIYNETITIYS